MYYCFYAKVKLIISYMLSYYAKYMAPKWRGEGVVEAVGGSKISETFTGERVRKF